MRIALVQERLTAYLVQIGSTYYRSTCYSANKFLQLSVDSQCLSFLFSPFFKQDPVGQPVSHKNSVEYTEHHDAF